MPYSRRPTLPTNVQAELLRRLLSVPGDGSRDLREPPDTATEPFSATVRHLLFGQVALAEGRTEDLARHVTAADEPSHPSPWLRLRVASLAQAGYRFTGDEAHLALGIRLAREVADRIDLPHMAVTARGILGTLHLLTGALHQVEECTRAGIELAAAADLGRHPHAALAHQFLGYALFEWNRLEEARAALERAWELASPTARGIRSGVARTMTELAVAKGDEEGAESWFRTLEEWVSEPMTMRNREWLAAVRARRGPASDHQLRALDAWRQRYDYRAERLAALPDDAAAARLHELGYLLGALEATRQWPDLLVTADTILRGARGGRAWFEAHAYAAQAVALEATGKTDEADAAWTAALAAGRSGSLTRTYTSGSTLRLRLLARAAAREETRHDAERILEAAGVGESVRAEDLTSRQVQVLEKVAEGLSNRHTADALGLAETTVRTHLRHIYTRLGVGSRTAAVREARRLGILDSVSR